MDFPIKNGGSFHCKLLVHQRVRIPKKSSHHETDEESDTQQLQHLLSELQVGLPAAAVEVEKVEIWEQLQGLNVYGKCMEMRKMMEPMEPPS